MSLSFSNRRCWSLLAVLTKQSPCHHTPSPVVARFLLAILTKQSPCHHTPSPVVARFLLAVLTKQSPCHYPPSRLCEVPSCCPHEAISVSLSFSNRRCEVPSCYPHEAISVSLSPSPSLRGSFLLPSRSNLQVPQRKKILSLSI